MPVFYVVIGCPEKVYVQVVTMFLAREETKKIMRFEEGEGSNK